MPMPAAKVEPTIGKRWAAAFREHERDARWLALIGDNEMVLTETQADVLSALLAAGEAGIPGGPRGQVIRVANALGLVVQTVLGKPGERLRYRLVGPSCYLKRYLFPTP